MEVGNIGMRSKKYPGWFSFKYWSIYLWFVADVKLDRLVCFFYPYSFKEYRYRVNKHLAVKVISASN